MDKNVFLANSIVDISPIKLPFSPRKYEIASDRKIEKEEHVRPFLLFFFNFIRLRTLVTHDNVHAPGSLIPLSAQ